MLSARKLYITCLIYSYSYTLRHPFDIIYLPNSYESHSDSFYLASNDQLTSRVDSGNISIHFINFEKRYKKLSVFTCMQTLNFNSSFKQRVR